MKWHASYFLVGAQLVETLDKRRHYKWPAYLKIIVARWGYGLSGNWWICTGSKRFKKIWFNNIIYYFRVNTYQVIWILKPYCGKKSKTHFLSPLGTSTIVSERAQMAPSVLYTEVAGSLLVDFVLERIKGLSGTRLALSEWVLSEWMKHSSRKMSA